MSDEPETGVVLKMDTLAHQKFIVEEAMALARHLEGREKPSPEALHFAFYQLGVRAWIDPSTRIVKYDYRMTRS